jgi:adenine phosphoribosyltransferase
MDLKSKIADYPDFPKKGILFRDISPVLKDPSAFRQLIDQMAEALPESIDAFAGIDARGFIFATALSQKLGKGLLMVRKKGKLPGKTISISYGLEYGGDTIELQEGAVRKGERIAIVDDLLATGGTASAAAALVEKAGGNVACMVFAIELEGLAGRNKLSGYRIESILKY